MTDFSSHINTHIAPAVRPKIDVLLSPTQPAPALNLVPSIADQEEDDSTIKCICGFKHDDGNSVLCEKCNTWQHTGCYYYDEVRDRVPQGDELSAILHFCADCGPRPIDVQAAINRQRTRLGDFDHDDKKNKKPPSKSHKKKTKVPEIHGALTNGWAADANIPQDRASRSPRDPLPPSKKIKPSHHSSNSINMSGQPFHLLSHPHKRSGSSMQSPIKPSARNSFPKLIKEQFSDEFMHLYDNDPGEQDMRTNMFSDLHISQDLSNWAHDVEALKAATHGFAHAEVFHRIDQPLESIIGPAPLKHLREDNSGTRDGRYPRWVILTSDGFTKQNSIIGELKGKIGHMRDYISDPENRWDWLRHPAPFVFFHPKLPLYVDTRSGGTICRYLRRSCRPNLSMSTFLVNEKDYHFCFIAKEDIRDGDELTIGWVPDEHMRKLSNKAGMTQDLTPDSERYFVDWVGKVYPEFGGCACGMPESCWFVKYGPGNYASGRVMSSHSKRRTHAATQDASDGEDTKSTSRSNSGSRDLTPTGHISNDFGLGLEISEREKRKIAAADKTKEFDKQPAVKKKKRNSGGSSVNTPSVASSKPLGHTATSSSQPNTPGFPPKPQYADASTSRTKSGSPTAKGSNGFVRPRNPNSTIVKKRTSCPSTPLISSPLTRPNYVDGATQTDRNDQADWYQPPQSPNRPRKPYMSVTKRLLLRSQYDREKLEERKRSVEGMICQQSPGVQSRAAISNLHISQVQEDIEMQDVDHVQEPSDRKTAPGQPAASSIPFASPELIPPPRPPSDHPAINGFHAPDLHVQLPSKPFNQSDSSSSTPLTQTPTSTIPQFPFTQTSSSYPPFLTPSSAGLVQPSPVKKKVSLSEYMKRKGSTSTDAKQTSGSPEMSHSPLKPPLTAPNGAQTMEGSALVDTPNKEESNPLETSSERNKGMTLTPIPDEKQADVV